MQVAYDERTVIVEGQSKRSLAFSIDVKNPMVFNILRKNLYSNPIKAICQEIISNAYDANVESGRSNMPIQVKLPSPIDPTWSVSDNGIGIDPQRIEEVFVKFCASTKRNDNEQIGGFGLGAKTPFAYGDSFTVITVSKDADGQNMQRTYLAYLDKTEIGVMDLINEKPTSEPTGTTIQITVAEKDYREFIEQTNKVARFLEPISINGEEPSKLVKKLEGTNWFVTDLDDTNMVGVLVGNIFYPLEDDLNNPTINSLMELYRRTSQETLIIKLPIGSVNLTASRDALELNDRTKAALINACEVVKAELADEAISKLNEQKTLLEVLEAARSMRAAKLVQSYNWNNIPVIDGYKVVEGYSLPHVCIERFTKNHKDKLETQASCYLHVKKTTALAYGNKKIKHLKRRIKALLSQNQYKSVDIIHMPDDAQKAQATLEAGYFSALTFIDMETIEPLPIERSTRTGSPVARTPEFKEWKDGDWYELREDFDFEEDEFVWVALNRNHMESCIPNWHCRSLQSLVQEILGNDVPLIGVPDRFIKKLKKLDVNNNGIELDNFVKNQMKNFLLDPSRYEILASHTINFRTDKIFGSIEKFNLPAGHLLLQYKAFTDSILASRNTFRYADLLNNLLSRGTYEKPPEYKAVVTKLNAEYNRFLLAITQKYTMLDFIPTYIDDEDVPKIESYIKMVDAKI